MQLLVVYFRIEIEILISEALIDSKISHEEYNIIINEEEEYGRLKENIRMIKSEKSYAEKDELNEKDEKNEINKIIREKEEGEKIEISKFSRKNNDNT